VAEIELLVEDVDVQAIARVLEDGPTTFRDHKDLPVLLVAKRGQDLANTLRLANVATKVEVSVGAA